MGWSAVCGRHCCFTLCCGCQYHGLVCSLWASLWLYFVLWLSVSWVGLQSVGVIVALLCVVAVSIMGWSAVCGCHCCFTLCCGCQYHGLVCSLWATLLLYFVLWLSVSWVGLQSVGVIVALLCDVAVSIMGWSAVCGRHCGFTLCCGCQYHGLVCSLWVSLLLYFVLLLSVSWVGLQSVGVIVALLCVVAVSIMGWSAVCGRHCCFTLCCGCQYHRLVCSLWASLLLYFVLWLSVSWVGLQSVGVIVALLCAVAVSIMGWSAVCGRHCCFTL